MRNAVLLCLGFLAINCGKKKDNNVSIETRKSSDIEMAALYAHFTENPVSQEQKEDNAIIDYAVEKELPLKRTDDGIYYMITEEGRGPKLKFGETIKMDYRGYFLDGKEFDSSYARGVPITFQIGQMVRGMNLVLTKFKSASKGIMIIPSRHAYGASENAPVPPNSILVFEVHVIF